MFYITHQADGQPSVKLDGRHALTSECVLDTELRGHEKDSTDKMNPRNHFANSIFVREWCRRNGILLSTSKMSLGCVTQVCLSGGDPKRMNFWFGKRGAARARTENES